MINRVRFTRFFSTSYLTSANGLDANIGDCGSWVVDKITYEVYGHLIASDGFREAYIVPLHSTLSNMKNQLEAKDVCLPSQQEVVAWSARTIDSTIRSKRPPFIETPKRSVQEKSLQTTRSSLPISLPGMSGKKAVGILYSLLLLVDQMLTASLPYSIR
jgi:hypothetical protein